MPRTRTQESREIAVATPLGEEVLLLRAFSGTEAVSTLFEYELELVSENHDIAYTDLVGEPVKVRMERGGDEPRYLSGIVSRFVQTGEGGVMSEYRATVVPWLWLLTRRSDFRIFQAKTVPDIIKQVFRDLGLTDFEDKLDGTYREREYCVQYRETDFNFVSRLMEEEGIYYFFRHEDGKHVLVLADSTTAVAAVPGYEEIRYKPFDAVQTDREFIHTWEVERQLQPGRYAHTDFDFKAPKKDLLALARATRAGADNSFEVFDYPGNHEKAADGEGAASVRLDEYQARLEVARGTSDSRGIAAGSKFTLADFRREDQNKEHLVTSTVIRARSDQFESSGLRDAGPIVSVRFTAIDAGQVYRAPRTTPRPVVQGPQTAIVVGKAGEEVWTDEHGRVKVQFHWDRASPGDENSSCWIRVSQPWAGKKWGGISIPRIGQEVVVEFLEGDPDRPIITGRVYNGENKPPHDLPGKACLSGMKSQTIKGGGYNEITLDDTAGAEKITIHGQYDMSTTVKHDQTCAVNNNRTSTVDVDDTETVGANQAINVGADQKLTVGANQTVSVGAAQAETVGAARTVGVGANDKLTVGGTQTIAVSGAISITSDAKITLTVGGSTIEIGPAEIAISSTAIKISGTTIESAAEASHKIGGAAVEIKADGAITSEAGGVNAVKGATVKLN